MTTKASKKGSKQAESKQVEKLPRVQRRPKTSEGRKSTISIEDKTGMILMYNGGASVSDIAQQYGVSRTTIYKIFREAGGWD